MLWLVVNKITLSSCTNYSFWCFPIQLTVRVCIVIISSSSIHSVNQLLCAICPPATGAAAGFIFIALPTQKDIPSISRQKLSLSACRLPIRPGQCSSSCSTGSLVICLGLVHAVPGGDWRVHVFLAPSTRNVRWALFLYWSLMAMCGWRSCPG